MKYTKKQITEAIKYWKNQLKMMHESNNLPIEVELADEFESYSNGPYDNKIIDDASLTIEKAFAELKSSGFGNDMSGALVSKDDDYIKFHGINSYGWLAWQAKESGHNVDPTDDELMEELDYSISFIDDILPVLGQAKSLPATTEVTKLIETSDYAIVYFDDMRDSYVAVNFFEKDWNKLIAKFTTMAQI